MQENNIEKKIDELIEYITYYRVPELNIKYTPQKYISMAVECAELHKLAFGDKKYLNFGKEVVVCATGPTFDYFKPIENAYYIGVNNAYKSDKIKFDAMFCQDARLVFNRMLQKEFIEYRNQDCIKFIGNNQPITNIVNANNYKVFYYMTENSFNFNINLRALPDFLSVVFAAMSYALWTMPKRIFLVGADCSHGHAESLNTNHGADATNLVKAWQEMAKFIKKFYPDVQVISVNPIGLKGLFDDEMYTEDFLKTDMAPKNIQILKQDGSIVNY